MSREKDGYQDFLTFVELYTNPNRWGTETHPRRRGIMPKGVLYSDEMFYQECS